MDQTISIIIPVYNVEDYVKRCVDSVTAQSYKDLEILIVDDGSTDSSGKICDLLAQEDSRIKVIHQKNQGLGAARNTALEMMSGEYVFFIDSDDYIFPDILEKLYLASQEYGADLVCCGYQSGKKKYYCSGRVECYPNVGMAVQKMFICDGLDSNAVCKLYSSKLFSHMRYPNCAYEVVPVTYKVLLNAERIVNIGECGYYIEKREGSITRAKFGSNNLLFITMSRDVCEDPEIVELGLTAYAFSAYLTALVGMTERACDDKQAQKSEEYKEVMKQFKKEYYNIQVDPYLTKRKKIIAMLVKCRIYEMCKTIYRLFR